MRELPCTPEFSTSLMSGRILGQRPRGWLNPASGTGQAELRVPRLQPAVLAAELRQIAPADAFALARYTASTAETIVAWKERGDASAQAHMVAAFTTLYADAIRTWGVVDVVPVPSSVAAGVRRGGLPLAETVRHAMARVGVDAQHLHQPLVRRGRLDQVGLGLATRMTNANAGFTIRRRISPHAGPVVVVDDVITSGATVVTCSHLLTSLGWHVSALIAPFARELVDCAPSRW